MTIGARTQIKVQDEGVEEVLNELKSTFALGIIFEVAIPIAAASKLPGVVREMQAREAWVWSYTRESWPGLHGVIQSSVLVGGAVIIAEGDQGPEFEFDLLCE
jgi:hypothetical protein